MVFEKFYGEGDIFSGLHCVTCGDILDPVILLHRVTQDAEVEVPEREEDVILLVKKYMKSKLKSARLPAERSCATRTG
jgi:hypothetical protein